MVQYKLKNRKRLKKKSICNLCFQGSVKNLKIHEVKEYTHKKDAIQGCDQTAI